MSAFRKVLVTGARGQLGWELRRCLPPDVDACWTDVYELDIANSDTVDKLIDDLKPAIVINAAAYTAVDKAESERELAFRINYEGAANLAKASVRVGARFIHVSTDFVFAGKGCVYQPNDAVTPLSNYGESKAPGEKAVLEANLNAVIVRTAWVYSAHGGNFVKTMLKLMAERPSISVISDQIGSPTWAAGLASFLWNVSESDSPLTGILHYTDSGVASWYDFAVAIQEEALALGLLRQAIPINPIPSAEYPTPATRPSFSVLDKASSIALTGAAPHWRVQLRTMLKQLKSDF